MRKPEASCPKCGEPINDEAALIAKKGGFDDTPPPTPVDELDELENIETELELEEGDDDFIENTDDLVGNDESDMSEIMEHIDDGVTDQNL